MAKQHILKVATSIRTIDSKAVDYRKNRWPSVAAALAGIPVEGFTDPATTIFYPGRYVGLIVPVIENGRSVLYWWEENTTNPGFVPFLGRLKDYVDSSILTLQNDLEDQIEDLRNDVNNNVIHTEGDETKNGRLTLTSPLTVAEGVADNEAVTVAQMIKLPNDIRFQKINKNIPNIRVTTSAFNKCREFLRVVAANNYGYFKVFVVNQNSTVKTFEFMSGYDALTTTWSKLTPLQVYNDRGQDFDIEIRKVDNFGPTNFGILFRYHNTTPGSGSEASIKVDFALQLPAVGTNYDQFDIQNTPEYDFDGINGLYGIKLTQTGDGRNYVDDLGQLFVKDGSQLILDLQNYKADTAYVNARLQVVEEDIEHIEEVLLPLKQDKATADSTYAEVLQRLEFLQSQLDSIPDTFEITEAMIAALPLITNQAELDALEAGTPYRSQGFVMYKIEDGTFGVEFDYTFGGGDTGEGDEYNGIFAEQFELQFEL